ncbi:MAG: hypothetical protein IAG13_04570 [Deltaproteobacteria bacterium]|nr:hypothetical protein [Nannocystaceae bacterium]
MPVLASAALYIALLLSCERGREIGQPCDRGEACASGVCTIGLGFSDAVCTQRCRGEGKGTCPSGWQCAGTARQAAAPSGMPSQSVCVPETVDAAAGADAPTVPAPPKFDNQP